MDHRLPHAIALFNSGEFYACHDCLESIWHDAPMGDRPFYQGLLQIAVGLYHWQNANYRGAMALIGSGISHLRHCRLSRKFRKGAKSQSKNYHKQRKRLGRVPA